MFFCADLLFVPEDVQPIMEKKENIKKKLKRLKIFLEINVNPVLAANLCYYEKMAVRRKIFLYDLLSGAN